jgi:hypothetical protein
MNNDKLGELQFVSLTWYSICCEIHASAQLEELRSDPASVRLLDPLLSNHWLTGKARLTRLNSVVVHVLHTSFRLQHLP